MNQENIEEKITQGFNEIRLGLVLQAKIERVFQYEIKEETYNVLESPNCIPYV